MIEQPLAFVNVHKPTGPTSTQVTSQIRRIFSAWSGSKLAAGHLGTLDPAASGVLPVALGKATRLIPFLEDRRKVYVCTLVLGRMTTTGDALGETVRETPVPPEASTLLAQVLPQFMGTISQIPPMYSAVHHEGRRLYDIARAGITVERAARSVIIHDLRMLEGEEPHVLRLRVTCGEGTYIRTLCEDLGRAIGVAAHMGSLVREEAGPFTLDQSHTLEEIAASPAQALIAPESLIPFPTITLDGEASTDFRMGRMVAFSSHTTCKHVFVRDASSGLIGLGEHLGVLLAPRKVFV